MLIRREGDCAATGTLKPGLGPAGMRQAGTVTCCNDDGRPTFKAASWRRAGAVPVCGPACIQVAPNIAGHTVINWPLQGTLVDISGNALPPSVVTGPESWAPLGGDCLQGFNFLGETATPNLLAAPSSPLYRLGGELALEFWIVPSATFVQTFALCESFGDVSVLYSFFTDILINVSYYDNTFHGVEFAPPIGYTPFVTAGVPVYLGFRRRQTGVGTFRNEMFANGVNQGGFVNTVTNVPAGDEIFYVGGTASSPNLRGPVASVRLLDVAPSDAEMLAHYVAVSGHP